MKDGFIMVLANVGSECQGTSHQVHSPEGRSYVQFENVSRIAKIASVSSDYIGR